MHQGGTELSVDQSSLTGESVPAECIQGNSIALYFGCIFCVSVVRVRLDFHAAYVHVCVLACVCVFYMCEWQFVCVGIWTCG